MPDPPADAAKPLMADKAGVPATKAQGFRASFTKAMQSPGGSLFRRPSKVMKTKSAIDGEKEEEENQILCIAIVVMFTLFGLALLDSFTTHFMERASHALADWTMDNAPGSFLAFELIITVLIILCLPYGPLAVLSGALFTQKYGNHGIWIATVALFCSTLLGEAICFFLARYKLKYTVQRQIGKKPELNFLKNLDRLIQDGQGIEMVCLCRLAPIPKGPVNYFLGTTSVRAGYAALSVFISVVPCTWTGLRCNKPSALVSLWPPPGDRARLYGRFLRREPSDVLPRRLHRRRGEARGQELAARRLRLRRPGAQLLLAHLLDRLAREEEARVVRRRGQAVSG